MKRSIVIFPIIALVVFAMLLVSCGREFDMHEDPSVEDMIAIGKAFLKENKGGDAATAFEYALKLDSNNTDANMGLILGNTMAFVNLVDMLIEMFGSMLGGESEPADDFTQDASEPQPGPMIGDYIQEFLGDTVEIDFILNEQSYDKLVPGTDFDFEIEYYNFVFGGENIISFGGEFDKTDLYVFGAVTSIMNAILDIAQGHDLNFNFANLSIPTLDFENDPIGALQGIAALLENLMTDPYFDQFLYLKEEGGAQRMKNAGVNLGNAFDRLGKAFDQLATETDQQLNDQVRYYDANKNNHYDQEIDPIQIADVLTIDPQLAPVIQQLCWDMSLVFWEGSDADPNPYTVDKLNLAMFNDLLIYLGILNSPILPDWLGIDIGSFFSNPTQDGLRTILFAVIDLINILVEFLEGV